jgi:hypothetical protein
VPARHRYEVHQICDGWFLIGLVPDRHLRALELEATGQAPTSFDSRDLSPTVGKCQIREFTTELIDRRVAKVGVQQHARDGEHRRRNDPEGNGDSPLTRTAHRSSPSRRSIRSARPFRTALRNAPNIGSRRCRTSPSQIAGRVAALATVDEE